MLVFRGSPVLKPRVLARSGSMMLQVDRNEKIHMTSRWVPVDTVSENYQKYLRHYVEPQTAQKLLRFRSSSLSVSNSPPKLCRPTIRVLRCRMVTYTLECPRIFVVAVFFDTCSRCPSNRLAHNLGLLLIPRIIFLAYRCKAPWRSCYHTQSLTKHNRTLAFSPTTLMLGYPFLPPVSVPTLIVGTTFVRPPCGTRKTVVVVVVDVEYYCFLIIITVGTPNSLDPVWPRKYKHFPNRKNEYCSRLMTGTNRPVVAGIVFCFWVSNFDPCFCKTDMRSFFKTYEAGDSVLCSNH